LTSGTGTQTGRLWRDGVPSACGTAKEPPGIFDTGGLRAFDSYTFTACRNACAQVTVTSDNGIRLFSTAYSPAFNSGTVDANYAGDSGSSGSTLGYGVSTVAG